MFFVIVVICDFDLPVVAISGLIILILLICRFDVVVFDTLC